MIVIIGKVTVKAGKEDEFNTEVNKAIEASLKEDGVSRYELVRSVAEPNDYLLIEEYENESALASHSEAEHMKILGASLANLVAGPPDVKRYMVTSVEDL